MSWSVAMAASNARFGYPTRWTKKRIEARFDKGVLKVTVPKRAEAASEQRKIEIKKS
jgi:HSP20 family molecular chaperone IbpA